MIGVDRSALIAIIGDETESASFAELMIKDRSVRIPSATCVETRIVDRTKFPSDDVDRLGRIIALARTEVVAFDEAQSDIAVEAYVRFGGGSDHEAQLNFGDCFAYALSDLLGAPLLSKGDDFAATDITAALKA